MGGKQDDNIAAVRRRAPSRLYLDHSRKVKSKASRWFLEGCSGHSSSAGNTASGNTTRGNNYNKAKTPCRQPVPKTSGAKKDKGAVSALAYFSRRSEGSMATCEGQSVKSYLQSSTNFFQQISGLTLLGRTTIYRDIFQRAYCTAVVTHIHIGLGKIKHGFHFVDT